MDIIAGTVGFFDPLFKPKVERLVESSGASHSVASKPCD